MDLEGKLVIVRDSTGSSTEGIHAGYEDDHGLMFLLLDKSRQINYVNASTEKPTSEGWKIKGRNRIALHLVVGMHESHLDGR